MGDQRRFRVNPEPLAVVPSDPFERERYLAERAQARALRAEAERDTLAGQMGYVAEGIVTALLYLNDGDPSPQVAEWSDATRTLVRELSRIHRAGIDLPSAPSAWVATLRADDEARGTCSPCHGAGVIDCSPGPVSDCDYCGGTGRA